MKNEDLEELSTGASVYLQGFMIGFCLLMAALTALFIPFRRLDFEGYLAVFLIFSALVLFAMLPLIYSDVYLSGDSIVIKKIIGTKRRPISDFKALDATILPFACYIEFQDGKRVYFSLTPSEIVKNITGSDIIKNLRCRIEDRISK
jgi:hypothetical protein